MALLWFYAVLLLHLTGAGSNPVETFHFSAHAGVTHPPGQQGLPGRDGQDGRDGRDGPAGPKGDKGEPGASVQGPPGPQGPIGSPGLQGLSGSPGLPVKSGIPEQKGDSGSTETSQASVGALQEEIRILQYDLFLIEKATRFHKFFSIGQKYYMSDGMVKNFNEGKEYCHGLGADLVLPRNEEENRALAKVRSMFGSRDAMIGATDREKKGEWVDVKKLPLTFYKWSEGEPNNAKGNENCISMIPSGEWYDSKCNLATLIVCELA